MRELEQKEENIKAVQEIAEQLLLENHPARLTIEVRQGGVWAEYGWLYQLKPQIPTTKRLLRSVSGITFSVNSSDSSLRPLLKKGSSFLQALGSRF